MTETSQSEATGRNLIVCCDGTNNEFGKENTNVIRLVQVIDRDPERQRLYYQAGVGTLPEPDVITKGRTKVYDVLGLAFGLGVLKNIRDAYRFIMEVWERGDRIFLFGFSRGAYSVRVLAGMLHTVGLLGRGSVEMVPYAMRIYKQLDEKKEDEDSLRKWKQLCDEFRWTFARPMFDGDEERHCTVHFVGVWDTVSSVGWVANPAKFPHTAANPSIEIIRHAVSLDERRAFFRQNLFHKATAKQDLIEIWFPGVHCDVGGGYPSLFRSNPDVYSELWRLPFQWILREARHAGLIVDDSRLIKILRSNLEERAIWADPIHNSLVGPWHLAEHWRKRVWNFERKKYEWKAGKYTPRTVPENALIHLSLLERLKSDSLGYAPINIAPQFRVHVKTLQTLPEVLPYTGKPS